MSAPPDLRVLCRKLAATAPADLPALCPILVNHILRCGGPLAAPADQLKSGASETAVLVHKLKTQVNALLHGKSAHGRFAGMVLAKAVIDVGGWECLRTSENWLRGMLSMLQRPDPFASKELTLAVLARVYALLHHYPTLVREMATPTVPSFATACLQLLRPPPTGKPQPPASLVEAALRALAALLPLYPTTLRPFSVQLRQAVHVYVAPTPTPTLVLGLVPHSLARAAARLLALLPYTAPRNGHADEWTRLVDALLLDAHTTADQVLRAVQEPRDHPAAATADYTPAAPVACDGPPAGGGDGPDDLPPWTGLAAGTARLVGLLDALAEVLRTPTKTAVALPLGRIAGLVSRLSLVLPPTDLSASASASVSASSAALLNPNIGRDEREELWAALPAIHIAALGLLRAAADRTAAHLGPLAPALLEDAVRIFRPSSAWPPVRHAAYDLVHRLLPLAAPALERPAVHALAPVLHACCDDLLAAAGRAPQAPAAALKTAAGPQRAAAPNNKRVNGNADLYLHPTAGAHTEAAPAVLDPAHRTAAEALLVVLLVHLPQQHLRKADRALLDRTAILTADKAAMLASVLHPYADRSGRYFANTIPFLLRAYPADLDVEVLRTNLRTAPHYYASSFATAAERETIQEADQDDQDAQDAPIPLAADDADETQDVPMWSAGDAPLPALGANVFGGDTSFAARSKPAEALSAAPAFEPLTLKRKPEVDETQTSAPKRLDTRQTAAMDADDSGDGDSDGEGSVQLDMVFDGESDDE